MTYNFDQILNHQQQNSIKHNANRQFFGTDDVLPLWVADMDFAVAPAISQAIQQRSQYPIFGYTFYPETMYQALIDWFSQRHGWQINRQQIMMTNGVVTAIHAVIQALTQVGDKIIIQPPVYPPFFSSVTTCQRQLLLNPLRYQDNDYVIDFEHLEHCAKQGAKMLIFCSPHNPVGRVWTKAELEQLLSIARRYQLIILSDEIHADLVYQPHQHIPLATLAHEEDVIVTAIAPSKSFNIAGLMLSSLVVSHAPSQQAIHQVLQGLHLGNSNPFSIVAFEAAYAHGADWLNAVLGYLQANRDFALDFIAQHCPRLSATSPQGTYLLWLNCQQLGLNNQQLRQLFTHEAKVALNAGDTFGEVGSGFMRLNFALPQSKLKQALVQLKEAVDKNQHSPHVY